ncbi:MAG TPA: hypothetical protein PKJ79_12640 [Quisquiliibacterium sp.]|nr:hypothetical protein [Quisquiliibacterium sp.]
MKRREFLRRSAGVVSLGAGAGLLAAPSAHAQSGGYRALVCLFLYGGNDGLNMVPRVDADGYAKYAAVRAVWRCPVPASRRWMRTTGCIRTSRRSRPCGTRAASR